MPTNVPLPVPHPDPLPGQTFLTGARPTPPHVLRATPAYYPLYAPPAMWSRVPPKLDIWGNSTYGDCVSAEEAFALACHDPEIFVDEATVVAWARHNGYLNGADLVEVMDSMARSGFVVGPQQYNDGPHQVVQFSDEPSLRSAIALGPVKISIDSSALPSGAGNNQGWFTTGSGTGRSQDHCVGLSGYGPAGFLYKMLALPVPSGLSADQDGYLLFTWSTLGFVTYKWLMNSSNEMHVRNPTTIGVPPLPLPPPPVPPDWTPHPHGN